MKRRRMFPLVLCNMQIYAANEFDQSFLLVNLMEIKRVANNLKMVLDHLWITVKRRGVSIGNTEVPFERLIKVLARIRPKFIKLKNERDSFDDFFAIY